VTSAREVAEGLLAKSGAALMSGDFDSFLECFALPQDIATFDGRKTIKTADDLREIFEGVRKLNRRRSITQVVRQCLEAEFRDENTITATHQSRNLSGDILVQGPITAYSIVENFEGVWKITYSQYAALDDPELNKTLSG
jgi:hypothetical protein